MYAAKKNRFALVRHTRFGLVSGGGLRSENRPRRANGPTVIHENTAGLGRPAACRRKTITARGFSELNYCIV